MKQVLKNLRSAVAAQAEWRAQGEAQLSAIRPEPQEPSPNLADLSDDEIEELAWHEFEKVAAKLLEWDRFFGGMLVDQDCDAATELRLHIQEALHNRKHGGEYPDERIMAEWVKRRDDEYNLGIGEELGFKDKG